MSDRTEWGRGHGGDPEPDGRLRRVLEPPEEQVDRVVRGALRGRRRRRSSLRLVAALSAAGVAVLLLGALLLSVVRWDSGPAPSSTVAAAPYSLTNRDGLLVVRSPDGGAAFLHSRERADEPPRGMVLIVSGGNRP